MVIVQPREVRVRVRVVVVDVAAVRMLPVIVLVARVPLFGRRWRDLAGTIDGGAVAARRRTLLRIGATRDQPEERDQRDGDGALPHGFFFGWLAIFCLSFASSSSTVPGALVLPL